MGIDIIIDEIANVGLTISLLVIFFAIIRWIENKINKK